MDGVRAGGQRAVVTGFVRWRGRRLAAAGAPPPGAGCHVTLLILSLFRRHSVFLAPGCLRFCTLAATRPGPCQHHLPSKRETFFVFIICFLVVSCFRYYIKMACESTALGNDGGSGMAALNVVVL